MYKRKILFNFFWSLYNRHVQSVLNLITN
jgi:hypothetical protein